MKEIKKQLAGLELQLARIFPLNNGEFKKVYGYSKEVRFIFVKGESVMTSPSSYKSHKIKHMTNFSLSLTKLQHLKHKMKVCPK